MRKSAIISDCGLYRYRLEREWEPSLYSLPIIMLNPSTADADLDDPTIRRCVSFAKREGYGGIIVMNLFAFRATSPDDMKSASDPFGHECGYHLDTLFEYANEYRTPILAAWGTHGNYRQRDAAIKATAKGWGTPLACLGKTAAGHPRHPLYVKGDQTFEEYA